MRCQVTLGFPSVHWKIEIYLTPYFLMTALHWDRYKLMLFAVFKDCEVTCHKIFASCVFFLHNAPSISWLNSDTGAVVKPQTAPVWGFCGKRVYPAQMKMFQTFSLKLLNAGWIMYMVARQGQNLGREFFLPSVEPTQRDSHLARGCCSHVSFQPT